MLERMYGLLKLKKISYQDVADNVDISPSCLTAWKNGVSKPSIDKVVAIADYLGVSLDYLTGRDKYSPAYAEDERELLNIYSTLPTSGKVSIMTEAYRQKKKANIGK